MLPKISIIIPCYNLENYIYPCLESIAKQPVGESEYIFVDDGSSDNTLAILDGFCSDKDHCKVIHQENAGVSAARNTALNYCKGEYVYLLDGDDMLTDNAVELMIKTSENADAVLSPVIIKKDNNLKAVPLNVPLGVFTPEVLYEKCRVFPTMPQLLYKREIIENSNLKFDKNLSVGEVYDFTIRFLAIAKSVVVAPTQFFFYVMRQGSATHKPNFERDITVLDTIRQYYKYGEKFEKYSSFNTTAFKMMMSFTYNKYVKLGLKDKEVYKHIKILLSDPIADKCINSVANSAKSPLKERLLASFVKTTGIRGYKLLASIL